MIYVISLAYVISSLWLAYMYSRNSKERDRRFQRKEESWDRERRQLIDRIMYMSDRPWTLPPQEIDDDEIEEDLPPDVLGVPLESEYTYTPMGTV